MARILRHRYDHCLPVSPILRSNKLGPAGILAFAPSSLPPSPPSPSVRRLVHLSARSMFIAIMFMNMLVTIIMEHYGTVRDAPGNKDIINQKIVEHVYSELKLYFIAHFHFVQPFCPLSRLLSAPPDFICLTAPSTASHAVA